jgi:hypothetical protein
VQCEEWNQAAYHTILDLSENIAIKAVSMLAEMNQESRGKLKNTMMTISVDRRKWKLRSTRSKLRIKGDKEPEGDAGSSWR